MWGRRHSRARWTPPKNFGRSTEEERPGRNSNRGSGPDEIRTTPGNACLLRNDSDEPKPEAVWVRTDPLANPVSSIPNSVPDASCDAHCA
jgi:hypothetical protein